MSNYILNNPGVYPSDAIIFEYLKDYKLLWKRLFETINNDYPMLNGTWKYYNDGKSWLYKMQNKAKTIFWLSLYEDSFRVTFYFNSKNEDIVSNSSIPQELKESFKVLNEGKKFKNLTIIAKNREDIDLILLLIKIKLSCK
jgi:hypothetical protein